MRHSRLIAVCLLVVGVACSREEPTGVGLTSRQIDPAPVREPTDPPGSCVEFYSLETLPRRDFALDATVVTIDADQVLLEVHHWFKGGSGESVTLRAPGDGPTDEFPQMVPGRRYLIAGDRGVIWACGFTRSWSGGEARQWQAVLD